MSGPTVKFSPDYPQKLVQIFQVGARVGRFGLVKPGNCSKYSPIYIFSGDTFKIVIDSAKNEIQTFLYSVIFRGVSWTTFNINSLWWWQASEEDVLRIYEIKISWYCNNNMHLRHF